MRAQRPQPGNRFASFVRASGQSLVRREINCGYLEFLRDGHVFVFVSSRRPLLFSLVLPKQCANQSLFALALILNVDHNVLSPQFRVFCMFAQGFSH